MNWNHLKSIDQLEEIKTQSLDTPVVIFKHSTRCSISAMALSRFERKLSKDDSDSFQPYLLDLISHRDISGEIQNMFGVVHESPQVLLIKDGKCDYSNTHMNINYDAVLGNL